MQRQVHVRNLEKSDLSSIVGIEERVTGVARAGYWQKRIELSEAIRPHWTSLIAEINSQVVGFILGRVGELEFGLPSSVAWIEIIGVDPAYRGHGIARSLARKFLESAEDHDIRTIFTLVDSSNREMADFFARVGFTQGKMLHFQKELGG